MAASDSDMIKQVTNLKQHTTKKKKTSIENALSTSQIILLGFLAVIFVGAVLLSMPFCAADSSFTSFADALFTSTTSVCVTGLVTVPTYSYWSLTGKIIILLLIQFGGLGFMTCFTLVMFIIRRRITLKERMTIRDALGSDRMGGLLRLVARITKGTFLAEGIGALLYAFVFIPEHGVAGGIWRSVFTSVSAFCNAGIDLVGDNSLAPYADNVIVNVTTSLLVITGGIGFPVWWDLLRTLRQERDARREKRVLPVPWWNRLSLHSKLAFVSTAALLGGGWLLIFLFEFHNSRTIGDMTLGGKLQASFFQSMTTRTAGFATINQAGFTLPSKILSVILMLIGGSPLGTAGGLKTVTVVILLITLLSVVRGREKTEVFHRTIPAQTVRKALALVTIYIGFLIVGIMALSAVMHTDDLMALIYEVASALATVGLTQGITSSLNLAGKLIIIVCMYIGRVGPISFAVAFTARHSRANNSIRYPEENITVG